MTLPYRPPGRPHGGGQVRSSLAGLPLLSTQHGDPRPEGRAGMTDQDGSASPGQCLRRRTRHRGDTADRCWEQPGTPPLRSCLRIPVRVNPIPASSGRTNRHRLNRGGGRQANAAPYRIVVVRLRDDFRTKAYMRRRTGEGMNKTEVIRCLKRYVAREVFSALQHSAGIIGGAA